MASWDTNSHGEWHISGESVIFLFEETIDLERFRLRPTLFWFNEEMIVIQSVIGSVRPSDVVRIDDTALSFNLIQIGCFHCRWLNGVTAINGFRFDHRFSIDITGSLAGIGWLNTIDFTKAFHVPSRNDFFFLTQSSVLDFPFAARRNYIVFLANSICARILLIRLDVSQVNRRYSGRVLQCFILVDILSFECAKFIHAVVV